MRTLTTEQKIELKAVVRNHHASKLRSISTRAICVCGSTSGGPAGTLECRSLLELISGVTPDEKGIAALKRLLYVWHAEALPAYKLSRAICACGYPAGGPSGTDACSAIKQLIVLSK